jgi:Kelch motif
VYDIQLARWKTFRDLHYTYWVSDLGSFVAQGKAYFVGGFSEDYRALRRVFSIDPIASLRTERLQVERNANMIDRRGDVGITVDESERYAYVSGGSSQSNEFCAPLASVERFDIETNEWEEMAPLQQARTGKSILQIDSHIVALGGAQQNLGKLCDKTSPNPSHLQTPVNSIEVYDNGQWGVVDNLSEYRYRSASVVVNNTVYSFGGQSVYFTVCTCHPTVDEVVIYELSTAQPDDPNYNIDTLIHSETNTLTAQPQTQFYAEGEVAGKDLNGYNKGEGEQSGSSTYRKDGFQNSGAPVIVSVTAFMATAIGVFGALVM